MGSKAAPGRANGGRSRAASQAVSVEQSFERLGFSRLFAANEEIYGEGEPVEHFYKVMSGSIRTYNALRSGHCRVNGFYLAGECFGLEANDRHSVSAEAIVDSQVLVIDRKKLMSRAACDITIARYLLAVAAAEMQCARGQARRLAMTAEERVTSFLSEIATRGCRQHEIDLSMPRRDIADYLGLTVETVSRTMTRLERSSAISMSGHRRIVLRNIGDMTGLGTQN